MRPMGLDRLFRMTEGVQVVRVSNNAILRIHIVGRTHPLQKDSGSFVNLIKKTGAGII